MTTLYTDAATVAAALNMNPEATLSGPVVAGANTLTVSAVPSTWAVGMYLALDYFNPGTREVVQINGVPSGANVPITPTLNDHVSGAPIAECSGIQDAIASACAAIDDFCYMRVQGAFAEQMLTESITAYIDNDGWLVIPCSLPKPQVNSIAALSYQPTPVDPVTTFSLPPQAWVENTYLLRVGGSNMSPVQGREVMATLTYTGGYSPLPSDIARAALALAARFYKEKDSGFSDTIGSADLGTLTYKKDIPSDIKMMLRHHVRYA
jgi:hypothetical protein